jgi:Skp family chaperone for outer membrane proteins
MNMKKTILPIMLSVIIVVVLCSGFIFKSKSKETEAQSDALAKQDVKIAALDKKIEEHNNTITVQNKLLAAQDKKLEALAGLTERLDKIQAGMNTKKIDINDSDMSKIRQIIEEQVKLNVKKAEMPAMGVVSIRRIFRDCKKTAKYREEANAERQQINAALVKLDNEIKSQREGLKTLKVGSDSHMAQVKEILQKQARLQAEQEFHKQQRNLKEQQITETIYADILRVTSEIAKEKGLELVFEASEPDLPASSPTELELSMGTHKLLYGGGCVDITDEVISKLDADLLGE